MRVLVFISILILVVLFLPSCNPYYTTPQPPEPSPSPSPDILIPSWLRTPKDIATYLRLSGARYVNDDFTTGYQDYRFTPAEFISWDIPDVNKPGRIITKIPFTGDCDDFAIFTAYLLQYLGYESYFIITRTGNILHALSYGIDSEGKHHIFDLWFYKEKFESVEEYLQKAYGSKVLSQAPIQEVLDTLYAQGHLRRVESHEVQ